MGGWREGGSGPSAMGAEHGAYCVGCCWGLMLVLFALGVMSLAWMVVVAALIFAQKVLPRGELLARVFAVAFIAIGVWVATAPGSVPGLTLPTSDGANRARARMMGMQPGMKPTQQMQKTEMQPGMKPMQRQMPKTKTPGMAPMTRSEPAMPTTEMSMQPEANSDRSMPSGVGP